LRYLLIGAPAYFLFEALKKFCQAQGIANGPTKVMLIISPINALLNYLLIFQLKLGLAGASLATSITYWLLFISMAAYIILVDGKRPLSGWTSQTYSGFPTFLKSATTSVFMVCSEWWALEILTLAASYLGIVNLAAHSILMTVASITFILPFGISVSGASRINHWLEYDEATLARRSLQAAFFLSTIFGVLITIFYRFAAPFIAAAFTSQLDTATTLSDVLPLVGICQLFEGISTIASGVLRGLNRHQVGTYTMLLTYYCLIFPLGFLLSFAYDMSLSGLWYAMIIGFAFNSLGLLVYLKCSVDWSNEVELVNTRDVDET
jgi:MATE family multidrug resistance protein